MPTKAHIIDDVPNPDEQLASATADALTTTFGIKEYVVTPGCLCCLTLCPQTLTLEAEEVVYKRSTPCDTQVKRMPYGQLGSVDKMTSCGCLIGVQSNLTSAAEGISPGCGCETAVVEEIVAELKARMKARGDTGNIKRAEQTIDLVSQVQVSVTALTAKIDLIMAHLNIPPPPEPAAMKR